MHPAEFCEHYMIASLFLMFVLNSTLALLLGIPYNKQKRKIILDPDQLILGQGEIVQIITSSVIVVTVFYLFLCGTRVITCYRSRVPKVNAFVAIVALSMLGACYLTACGGENCETDGFRNPKCYRRPDVDLSLTWFSTAVALTGVVASFVLHLYDVEAQPRPRPDNDGQQTARQDSLELVKTQGSSNENDCGEPQEEALVYCPPPPYEPSATLLSSYILPSIPLRKREMNKLGLTVIANIPMDSPFEFRSLGTEPRKRWRGRGRDVWEKKTLGASIEAERK